MSDVAEIEILQIVQYNFVNIKLYEKRLIGREIQHMRSVFLIISNTQ